MRPIRPTNGKYFQINTIRFSKKYDFKKYTFFKHTTTQSNKKPQTKSLITIPQRFHHPNNLIRTKTVPVLSQLVYPTKKKTIPFRTITTFHILTNNSDKKIKLSLLVYIIFLIFLLTYAAINDKKKKECKILRNKFKSALLLFLNGKIERGIISLIHLANENVKLKEGLLYLESGNIDAALNVFDDLLLNDMRIPDVYNLIKGILLNAQGKHTIAINYFNLAITARSSYVKHSAYCHLILALQKSGKITEANQYRQKINIADADINEFDRLYKNLSSNISTYPFRFKYSTGTLGNIKNKIITESNHMFQEIEKIDSEYLQQQNGNVVVRIWLATAESKVGHVSLQTDKYYISYWPTNKNIGANSMVSDILTDTISGWDAHHSTLWEDIFNEQRISDVSVGLTLDKDVINTTYEQFVSSGYRWSLLGSIVKKSQNCSGLVYSLLDKGGINNIINKDELFNLENNVSKTFKELVHTPEILTYLILISTVPFFPQIIPYTIPKSISAASVFFTRKSLTKRFFANRVSDYYNKLITPENINRIVTKAFLQEYDNDKKLKRSPLVTKQK